MANTLTCFNNDTVDGSFGVTSEIMLDQLTPWGSVAELTRGPQQFAAVGASRAATRW